MKSLRLKILEENLSRFQPAWAGSATVGQGIVEVLVGMGECGQRPWIKVFRTIARFLLERSCQPLAGRNQVVRLAAEEFIRRCQCAWNNFQLDGLRQVAKVEELPTEERISSLVYEGVGQAFTVGLVEMLQVRLDKIQQAVFIDP